MCMTPPLPPAGELRSAQRSRLEDAIRRGNPPVGLFRFAHERFVVAPGGCDVRVEDLMWLAVDAYLDTLAPDPHHPKGAHRRA